LFLLLLISACKNTQSTQSTSAAINQSADISTLFSLKTSSCMGPCPVFNFKLTSDSSYYFSGEANTGIEGELKKKLNEAKYNELMELLNSVSWSRFENKYESMQSDLPTRDFFYNLSQDSIFVRQNSLEPRELTVLSDNILKFVDDNKQ
jgi:hypothetical protein